MKRTFWLDRIDRARARHNVVWLSGVRRVGKTTLAKGLTGARYFDCELPRVRIDLGACRRKALLRRTMHHHLHSVLPPASSTYRKYVVVGFQSAPLRIWRRLVRLATGFSPTGS